MPGLDLEAVVRGVLPDQAELKEPGAREAARDFLREMLGDGTQWAEDVHRAAMLNGLSRTTLFKAKFDLHVRVGKVGQPGTREGGGWYWWLPGTRDVPPKSTAPWMRPRTVPSPGTPRNTSGNQAEEQA